MYSTPDIQKTFFLLLLLVVIGEFFSAPAITLADSAVITLLGEDADRYHTTSTKHLSVIFCSGSKSQGASWRRTSLSVEDCRQQC